jgi:tryptophan synthase alpha chain
MESKIRTKIEMLNHADQKALTVFLTSGYPYPQNFVELSLGIIHNGADILEIGIPFGDSLADGPIIQSSYTNALKNKINIEKTLNFVSGIRRSSEVPIILMGSANPILHYGKKEFVEAALESGVNGIIIPDVPLEEYDDFFEQDFGELDTILLTTPTSEERIKEIDKKSRGFVYCVSVVGTTGVRKSYDNYVLENIKKTYKSIVNNKMQIGFGISNPDNIKTFFPFCDGVIVGSAVIKHLMEDNTNFSNTFNFIKTLKSACYK